MFNVLYLDDEQDNLQAMQRVLRKKVEVETALTPAEAFHKLSHGEYSVVLTDQRMPDQTGVEFLKELKKKYPECMGILVTAYSDFEAVVEGINAGVIYRYLQKPWNETDLLFAITQADEKYSLRKDNLRLTKALQKENAYMSEEIDSTFDYSFLEKQDQGLKDVIQHISKVAPTTSTVLIRGESGTGKELVARSIHHNSARKKKPFVRVNCGALSENLLESELFGHEKGAFTGASQQRIGRFELADGGTLFLDEIGDVSPKLQVSLLRVLQENQFERLGGTETIDIDVRIIVATHKNLEQLCRAGQFREDLYYRLNVFPIHVPPLRERMKDIDNLVPRLVRKASGRTNLANKSVHPEALAKLKAYDWPGNIRELENILERALILSTDAQIMAHDLILGSDTSPGGDAIENVELTKEMIEEMLLNCQGNKVEAAKKLGVKRPTLYYHMKRLGI